MDTVTQAVGLAIMCVGLLGIFGSLVWAYEMVQPSARTRLICATAGDEACLEVVVVAALYEEFGVVCCFDESAKRYH